MPIRFLIVVAIWLCLAVTAQAQQASYGPVQPKETLSEIAQKVRQDPRIPLKIFVRAMQDANPHAFLNDNPGSLMIGSVLKVPNLKYNSATMTQAAAEALPDWPPPNDEVADAGTSDSKSGGQLNLSGMSSRQITDSMSELSDQISMQASIIEKLAKRGEINQDQINDFNTNMRSYQQKIALMEAQLSYLEDGQGEFRQLLENSSSRIDGIHSLLSQGVAEGSGFNSASTVNIAILVVLLLIGAFIVWSQLRGRGMLGSPGLDDMPMRPIVAGPTEPEPQSPPPSTAVQNKPVISKRPVIESKEMSDAQRLEKRMQWLRVLAKVDEAERFRDEVIHMMAEMPIRDMPQWEQICVMGLKLSPGDSLYSDDEPEDDISIKSEIESIKRQDQSDQAQAALLEAVKEQPPSSEDATRLRSNDDSDEIIFDGSVDQDISDQSAAVNAALSDDDVSSSQRALAFTHSPGPASLHGDYNEDSELTPMFHEALRNISDHFRALSEDELATKLELAKVYYELGDNENARDLVTEIIDECGEDYNDEASKMYRLLTGEGK